MKVREDGRCNKEIKYTKTMLEEVQLHNNISNTQLLSMAELISTI